MNIGAKIATGISGSVVTTVFSFMYGEGTITFYTMLALATFILLDWTSGSRAAKKDDSYVSSYGIDGVFRTFFMLMLPVGGHFIDMAFGLPPVFFGLLAWGLLYHTIKSSTANAIRAGWGDWIPDWILNKIADWVKSEIESKANRALQRKEESGIKNDKKD